MVGAGIGVTLIPEMAAPVEARSATVSIARLPQPRPTRTIGMVWRRTNPLADQLGEIAEIVRDAAAACVAPARVADASRRRDA
jgi:LysR family hydrogen peroxide-inducible transcriptional activator